jgi:hypothetical protein
MSKGTQDELQELIGLVLRENKTIAFPVSIPSSSSSSDPSMPSVSQASPPFNQHDNLVLSLSARVHVGVCNTTPPNPIDKRMVLHCHARMSSVRDR